MKTIFMGTPDFAAKSLQTLINGNYNIAAVFTGSDKPKGRGMKYVQSPVKQLALRSGIPVYHPEDLTAEEITGINPDLIAVVAFGKFLPGSILDIPRLGCINIHASLLPKYRGAAPIQHAVLNGETETGVTSQYMAVKMDEGDIIFAKKEQILPDDTSADLFERLADAGAILLTETIDAIIKGNAPRKPQNHEEATYAPMLTKDSATIDFNCSTHDIDCKIRAFIPWPVATFEHNGKILKIYAAETSSEKPEQPPGDISYSKKGISVTCADGTILITRVQAPGCKVMSAADYLNGERLL